MRRCEPAWPAFPYSNPARRTERRDRQREFILAKRDFYEVLGCQKGADDGDDDVVDADFEEDKDDDDKKSA